MLVRRLTAPGLILLAAAAGCQTAPSDLREWRATDHDHVAQSASAEPPRGRSSGKDMGIHGVDEVALAAWKQNCVRCHGVIGRGDGPQGAMFKANDLTRPEWQASVTDEQIAAVITSGKGQMPRFDLPSATVAGLTRLIRLIGEMQRQAAAQAAEADTAPNSAAPGATANAPGRAAASGAGNAAAAPRSTAGSARGSAASSTGGAPAGAQGATPERSAPADRGRAAPAL
jgi:hypothetical protein